MVYIASDIPLPLIEGKENTNVFSVTEISEKEKCVAKQFTKKYIAYAGSFEGCSCGFVYDNEPFEDEYEQWRDEAARESVRQLSSYLSEIAKFNSIELFACWDGEQEIETLERLTVTPDFFGGEEFSFGERQFLTISKI